MPIDPSRPYPPAPFGESPQVPSFTLTSDDFQDGQPLSAAQTALGGSVSPSLAWSGFPEATKSFLITATDPDPQRGTSWHWVVSDIPVSLTRLPAGTRRNMLAVLASVLSAPRPLAGVAGSLQRRNSIGAIGFMGAMPPKGDHAHRYFFAVHALDVAHLDIDEKAKPQQVVEAAAPRTLARALLMGTHQR